MTNTDEYKHEASGVTLYKEIAQPHVTTFQECFPAWAKYDVNAPDRKHQFEPRRITGQALASNLYDDAKAIMEGGRAKRKHRDESMTLGPFLSIRDGKSLSVSCADWVLSRVRERTIIVPGDTMSFEIVNHDNGWSLVTAQHSQILGSVWLAYIKTETIPV